MSLPRPAPQNSRRRAASRRLDPSRHPRALLLSGAVLTATSLTGCDQRFGMPDPASKQGDDVLKLWQASFYGAVVLGAIVLGLLFYSLVRHRRRNDELPKQTEGSVALEVTYTVIPFILVALLFGYGLKVQASQTHLSKDPDLRIDVTAYQWNWRFAYERENVTVESKPQVTSHDETLPLMVLPVDKTVRLNLIAADVAHSFFVPGFLTKRDVIPGIHNEIEVKPKRTGFYIGHCAEFCGLNHSQMNFRVKVVQQAEYDSWVQSEKGKVTTQ